MSYRHCWHLFCLLAVLAIQPSTGNGAIVTFRQGVNGYAGASNWSLDSGQPNTAFGGGSINVRGGTRFPVTGQPGQIQSLVLFDSIFGGSGIPLGATIVDATLEVTVEQGGSSNLDIVHVYRLSADWVSTPADPTWANFTYNGTGAGVDIGGETDRLVAGLGFGQNSQFHVLPIDVTADLIKWAANPSTNYGWAFLPGPQSQNLEKLYGNNASDIKLRPLLRVTFATSSVIPEPSSWFTMLSVVACIAWTRRRRAKMR